VVKINDGVLIVVYSKLKLIILVKKHNLVVALLKGLYLYTNLSFMLLCTTSDNELFLFFLMFSFIYYVNVKFNFN
jgi:hypothetical protein